MRLKSLGAVGKLRQVIPIGLAVAKEHMHQSTGERAIRARAHADKKIGLFCCCVVVGVDNNDFCTALAPGFERMGHYIDLGTRCIGAPDNDEVRATHLPGIHSGQTTGPRNKAVPAHVDTDGGIKA